MAIVNTTVLYICKSLKELFLRSLITHKKICVVTDVLSMGIASRYLQITNPESNVISQSYINKIRLTDSYSVWGNSYPLQHSLTNFWSELVGIRSFLEDHTCLVLRKQDSYMQKNETRPLSNTIHKKKLKMD